MKRGFGAVFFLFIFFISNASAQSSDVNAYYVGHSLMGSDKLGTMVQAIAESMGHTHSYDEQIKVGANLNWQWNSSQPGEALDTIPSGAFNHLILTEAVPLDNQIVWASTNEYATKFYDLAVSSNWNTQVYLYETWHCLDSGTALGCDYDAGSNVDWYQRLTDDLPKWEGIVDYVNANRTYYGKKMKVIPGGQAMKLLVDAIELGYFPGVTTVEKAFADNIHPNDAGMYLMACVVYAVIYNENPIGASYEITNQWGESYNLPGFLMSTLLQAVAWEAVKLYSQP